MAAVYRTFRRKGKPEEVPGFCRAATLEEVRGHNYALTVSVRGMLDPGTGMVVNVSLLGDVLERVVTKPLDRRDLTTDVPFLAGVLPTMENLAAAIGARLGPRLAKLGVRLSRIELAESETSRVTLDFP